ncbi:MAG: FAD-dependent oxidoreductase, partial [Cyanobacteria bacterium J06628_6]
SVRTKTNHYVTGRGGGREIDLRQFALEGMQLYGRLNSIQGSRLGFQDNLKQNLDHADAVAESIKQTIDKYIAQNQIEAPTEPPYEPAWQPQTVPLEADALAANITTIIWSTGYRMDFSWIDVPVFNGSGYPAHERGVAAVDGLYFVGLPWLYTWGSARFSGIAQDARYLVDCIALRHKMHYSRAVHIPDEAALGGYIMGI